MKECAQIFFPKDCLRKEGYLVGFNIQGFFFTILWIEDNEKLEALKTKLSNWEEQESFQKICNTQLQVLGVIRNNNKNQDASQDDETWLALQYKDSKPFIKELLICGYKYEVKTQFVLYDRLPKLQQISFNALNEGEQMLQKKKIEYQLEGDNIKTVFLVQLEQQVMKNKVELKELEFSLIHINLRKTIFNQYLKMNLPYSEQNYYKQYLQPKDEIIRYALYSIIIMSIFQHFVFRIALKILNIKIPFFSRKLSQLQILKHTTNQIKFKLSLIDQWDQLAKELLHPQQTRTFRQIHQRYYQLYAGFILMAADLIVGMLSMLLLYYNVSQLLSFIHKFGSNIHIEVLSKKIEWLMGFPAGLKTNTNLNKVLGQIILNIILYWNEFTEFVTPYEPYLIRIMIVFCLFGFTFETALAQDIIHLFTIHVYYIYRGLTLFYREMVQEVRTFYKVMIDKYYDHQLKKIDNYFFKWDQKIMAMFFFFFLLMMLPTVGLYYFWFLLIALFIYGTQVVLNTALQFFNHFPLFAIMIYWFKQSFFPKKVNLTVLKKTEEDVLYIELNPLPLPPSMLFRRFFKKILKMKKIFNIKSVLKSAFLGIDIMRVIQNESKKEKQRSESFTKKSESLKPMQISERITLYKNLLW